MSTPTPPSRPAPRRAPGASAPAPSPFKHRRAILSALDIEVPRSDPPAGYATGLALLAAFLILIGLSYLALLAFLAWLFGWHIYQGLTSLGQGPYFLFHFPMALLGGLLVCFLVKPVFFRDKRDADDFVALTPESEPLLFEFVGRLCDATGARRPAIIEIDCDPNAHARLLKHGAVGAMTTDDLVLRFGLPLAASMTVRQLSGVLAHELGHFNQRAGMRGSLLIRLMVNFFVRVVFQRDRLDLKLERLRRSPNGFGRLVYYPAALFIEAARGVLWLFAVLGQLLTTGVLRRMEYDADRVEAHVAGCREFATTSRLIMFLQIASRRAHADVADAWEQRRLADDMPRLVVAYARELARHKDDILKAIDEQTTGVFDTHPCHTDRVAAVNETEAPGLVACDVAAKHLFRNFDATCKSATQTMYRAILGDALDEGKLVPVAELVEQRRGERDSFDTLRRFFRNGAAPTRPILPAHDAHLPCRPGEDVAVKRELARARQEMLALAPLAADSARQYETSNATLVVAHAKIKFATLLASGASVQMSNAAQRDVQAHTPQRLHAVHNLIGFEKAARHRLTAALRLAQSPPWCEPTTTNTDAAAVPSARTVSHLTKVCQLLQPHVEKVEQLRELCLNLGVLMGAYDHQRPYPPLVRRILTATGEIIDRLKAMRPELANVPYPFAHAREGISVAATLFARLPDADDPVAAHTTATSVIDRFYDLLYRALAELTTHAERIERGVGLEALPDLPPPDEEEKEKEKKEEAEELAEDKRNSRRYWLGYGARAAGGVCLLSVLLFLSLSPPELPTLGWPSPGAGRSVARSSSTDTGYRPAGFRLSRRGPVTPVFRYAPSTPAYQPPAPTPSAETATEPAAAPSRLSPTQRRRLFGPAPDPNVPSVTTTPEQLDRMRSLNPNRPYYREIGPSSDPNAPKR